MALLPSKHNAVPRSSPACWPRCAAKTRSVKRSGAGTQRKKEEGRGWSSGPEGTEVGLSTPLFTRFQHRCIRISHPRALTRPRLDRRMVVGQELSRLDERLAALAHENQELREQSIKEQVYIAPSSLPPGQS